MKRLIYRQGSNCIGDIVVEVTDSFGQIKKTTPDELLGSLNDIEEKFAPKELYVVGDTNLARNRRVSIIGTRKPTAEGIEKATKIAEYLVKNNVVIVSGLARGIDTIAHKTAINNGGKTIAVIGTPLNKYYPQENRSLQQQIMNEHLVISQFPVGSQTYPSNFPARNRTMALLSQISIIIEAGEKSGTMHQGWEALRLGRKLFITDTVANNKKLSWPAKLVEYGAEILHTDNLPVLLEFLPETIGAIECVDF